MSDQGNSAGSPTAEKVTPASENAAANYFITKYALTERIFILRDAELFQGEYVTKKRRFDNHFYGLKHWHLTHEAAKVRAEKMRKEKIVSLKKQIARLEKLDFNSLGAEQ